MIKIVEKCTYPIAAASLGAFFYLVIFGIDTLNPRNIDWVMNLDSGIHYLGWSFLRNVPWSFPFGDIPDLIHPIGTSVARQDSIPLFALFFKMFSPWLGEPFQYFGFWAIMSFALQGLFGFIFLNCLTGDRRFSLAGSIFFILSPYFLFRQELTMRALASHWLILASFVLVVAPAKFEIRLFRVVVLNVLTIFIHPYLAAIVFSLTSVGLVFSQWRNNINIVKGMSLLLVFCGLSYYSLGYFEAVSVAAHGFGKWSADILTFFNSAGRGLIPTVPSMPDQYEGYSYLGAGILVGCGSSLFVLLKSRVRFSSEYLLLCIISFFMFLFSLSSIVTIGGNIIADLSGPYSLLGPIPGALRASGRLAGPLHYLLIASVLVIVHQKWFKKSLWIVLALILVQVVDLNGWIFKRDNWARKNAWQKISSASWQDYVKGKKSLKLIPIRFMYSNCYGLPVSRTGFTDEEYFTFGAFAAKNQLTINSGIDPRGDLNQYAEECAALPILLQAKRFDTETLFVVHPDFFERFKLDVGNSLTCQRTDGYYACWKDSIEQ